MNLIPAVQELINVITLELHLILGDNLLGLYLRGSLAVGDFDPETSDIDIVVVTQKPVSAREFDALRGAHERFRELPNPYAKRLEGSYIGCKAIKDFDKDERLHTAFGTDSPLEWFNHRDNWIIEHHVVR